MTGSMLGNFSNIEDTEKIKQIEQSQNITSDELPMPTITVNDISIVEGNSTKTATFTVSRSNNLLPISVQYKTNDGTATSSDYEDSSGTLIFPSNGPLSKTITIHVKDDSEIESNEIFYLDLLNCTGCVINDSQGKGTITNDDKFFAFQNSSRPILIAMIRGDVTNHQELVDVFKKYTVTSDLKFTSAGKVPKSIYDQLDANNIAFGLSLEKILMQSQVRQGESTYIGYDPEWFEGGNNTTPEAEYKDYVNSVKKASQYAHDNGFKFLLTPLYSDIKKHAKEFAPYVDVVVLQIPHFTRNYSTAVQTAVQDIKSINPNAAVLIQLIPKDEPMSKQNGVPTSVIDAYNSVREYVDGVLFYYYAHPNPVPVIEQFYQGIGLNPTQ
jgi:hypothetical protein